MDSFSINMTNITPIFRIFDIDKAKEFYIQFLEFNQDWSHHFEEGMPIYMQISFGNCTIHLSEHHGDCSPGGAIRIEVKNIESYHKKLILKNYKYARPGLETTPWKTREIRVGDPFGNRIIFYENV